MTRFRLLPTADLVAALVALAAGLCIAYVDSRPTWDDTGITVGALVAVAGVAAAVRPRSWWLIGLAVGLPVPVVNYALHANWQSLAAVGFALAAAGLGRLLGRGVGMAAPR